MTDDLVTRLRKGGSYEVDMVVMEEAAYRIEKLEAALREIRAMHYEDGVNDLEERDDSTYCIVCDALEGEDER